ncbi:MAG: LL-diaminopimelate aminotransferase [Fibrobacterota bacterium]
MAKLNANFDKLPASYLFREIKRRASLFQEKNPGLPVLRLGIGDTTQPLPPAVIAGLHAAVDKLSKKETYTGYLDDGNPDLREALKKRYAGRGVALTVDEIFISDGAKPDSANIQSIFDVRNIVAVQDPAYPVYVDTNVMAGRAGTLTKKGYSRFVYMPCTGENGFFPEVPKKKVDLIYLCSPNNPTGMVATKAQLKKFVDYAIKNKAIILFDAAYSTYISDPELPRTIYEIPGAEKCAIEISSFSKEAGFTGVRLGWTVVPKAAQCEGAKPGKVHALWSRRQATMFNGASNIVQEGGVAVMSEQGQKECKVIIDYYMNNAKVIREGLEKTGLKVYGGVNAPFLWVKAPGQMKSWDFFDKLLNEAHVVGTPGSGFGPCGEGYFRLSAFGDAELTRQAVASIRANLKI